MYKGCGTKWRLYNLTNVYQIFNELRFNFPSKSARTFWTTHYYLLHWEEENLILYYPNPKRQSVQAVIKFKFQTMKNVNQLNSPQENLAQEIVKTSNNISNANKH